MAEDHLNIYLTGVATDGDPQSNPSASLGGKRSGTVLKSLSASAPSNVTGVVINDVPSPSGAGSATLGFTFTGKLLAYTAPGDTAGPGVDVSADGSYVLYSDTATKYMIVTVTSASLPASNQSDSIALATMSENLFDNVLSGEAAVGRTEYRAVMVKNDSAAAMNSMKVWIETNTPFADDAVEIAIELPVSNAIQSIANETTAPTGLTFYTAAGEANALSIGNLAAGAVYGLWIKRVVSVTSQRYANNYFSFTFKADTV
ncbi:MAG: hypothetical protein OEY64_08530 [Nitrospinota bacterium]|nr:hypothetical protein [Nitrospinota bacterium]